MKRVASLLAATKDFLEAIWACDAESGLDGLLAEWRFLP